MKSNFRNHGKVEYLCIRPARLEPVKTCQSVQADIDQGLVGDHFCGKAGDDRMVTLIQAEHIELIGRMLDQEIDPALLRRNIVISGVNLLALKGKRFQIGEAIFEGTKPCPPCSRMEENLGHGGYNAMRGHGGLNAKVIREGSLALGDSLIVLADLEDNTNH